MWKSAKKNQRRSMVLNAIEATEKKTEIEFKQNKKWDKDEKYQMLYEIEDQLWKNKMD